MNDTFTVLLIAPDGEGHLPVRERLVRLDGHVHDALPTPAALAADSDLITIDLRTEADIDPEMLQSLTDDPRPLVALAPGPCATIRRLAGRRAGIMLMTGAEDDSGFRVALNVSRGLAARRRSPRPPAQRRAQIMSGLVPRAAALGV